MKKLMIMLAATAMTAALCAQEAGTAASIKADSLAVAATAANDGGDEIIATAEKKSPSLAKLPDDPSKSAMEKVNEVLEALDLEEGYDAEKKAIIQTGRSEMTIADPANDKDFMDKREQIGNIALLNAKAEVIRAIRSRLSAMDSVMTRLDESAESGRETFYAARDALLAKRAEIVQLLKEIDEKDAQTVAEVTLNDRFDAFLDALIKKIDNSYDVKAIAETKKIDAAVAQAAVDALKAKVGELVADYKKLATEAAKFPQEPSVASESVVSLLAKMPLLGATVLTQAESWDPETKQYCVAVAVVWSPKLQEAAFKLGMGDFSVTAKPGKLSRKEWIKAQNWCSMIGTRQFTDDEGRRYFVGIGAIEPGTGNEADAKRMFAETLARKNVGMALLGDMAAYREVRQHLAVYKDGSSETLKQLLDAIRARVERVADGCLSLKKTEVKHPITGRKIYVAAYYIDPALAKDAQKLVADSYAKAGLVARESTRKAGFGDGADAAYEAMNGNTPDYKDGAQVGIETVTKAKVEQKNGGSNKRLEGASPKKPVDKKPPVSHGGVHGDNPRTISTDF